MSFLEMKDVDVCYGDFKAVEKITLSVPEGSVVSLIGANGAGKSTIMNTICGWNKPSAGEIFFLGRNIAGKKPHQIARMGLTMLPEGGRCFEHLTVRDNLLLGAYQAKNEKERQRRLARVYELFPVLKEKEKQMCTYLSGGQRQMLAVGRGLMAQPKLFLCDEISLGLAPAVVKQLYAKMKEIAAMGITMLIVEQDVARSLSFSDYAYVVLEGRIVMQGKSKELAIEEVNEAYFGINRFSGGQKGENA